MESVSLRVKKHLSSEKGMLILELLIVGVIFTINELFFAGVRYSSQVALVCSLILISYSLHRRNSSWSAMGFRWPANWLKAIVSIVLCVMTIGVVFNFVIQPLFPSGANSISQGGSISVYEMLFQLIVIGIGTAAIGEELLFRGFILNNINKLLGENFAGTLLAVILQAFVFAILHSGIQGMVSAGVIGLILGIFYLISGRNLVVVMVAHAVPDILSIIGSYQDQ